MMVAIFGAGCSSKDKGPPASSGDALTLEPPPSGQGFQLDMKWTLQPGDEKTNCLLYTMPTVEGGAGVYVNGLEHQYTKHASHHIVLYSTLLSPADVAQYPNGFVEDCAGVDDKMSGIYYASQGPEGSVKMPPDVGLQIPNGSVVMLQFHTLNTGTEPANAETRLNVEYADTKPAKEAGVLFHYTNAIDLPPATSAKAGMHCVRPVDVNLMVVASHMHARGIGFSATTSDATGANPTTLFETKDWDSPVPRTFDPPLRLTKDQLVDFECHYQNSSSNEYFQGFSATKDEMCVLFALYYVDAGVPRMESNPFNGSPEWCSNGADGSRPRLFGTGGCKPLRQCIERLNSEIGTATNPFTTPKPQYHQWQKCVSESSDDSYARWNTYAGCRYNNCKSACLTNVSAADGGTYWDVYGSACQTCLTTNCSAEAAACDAN